jgi:hypothetical protein
MKIRRQIGLWKKKREDTQKIYQVLLRSVPGDPSRPEYFLPDELELDYETFLDVYETWVLWRATERRFLPTELRKQPDRLMEHLLYLDHIFENMAGQVMEQYKERSDG